MKCNMCGELGQFRARPIAMSSFYWWCQECYNHHDHQDLPHDVEHPILCWKCAELPATMWVENVASLPGQHIGARTYWCHVCYISDEITMPHRVHDMDSASEDDDDQDSELDDDASSCSSWNQIGSSSSSSWNHIEDDAKSLKQHEQPGSSPSSALQQQDQRPTAEQQQQEPSPAAAGAACHVNFGTWQEGEDIEFAIALSLSLAAECESRHVSSSNSSSASASAVPAAPEKLQRGTRLQRCQKLQRGVHPKSGLTFLEAIQEFPKWEAGERMLAEMDQQQQQAQVAKESAEGQGAALDEDDGQQSSSDDDDDDDRQQPGESFNDYESRVNFPPGVPLPSWPLSDFQWNKDLDH